MIFILPALAIAWVVPAEQLSLTAGVMQAFDAVFSEFGTQWLTPIFGIMLVTASLGGMLTWLAGPSKGLLLISRAEGYLPPFLQALNKHGVPQNILVTQGVVTTFIALGYALIPDVSSAYWIFSVITTQVYLIVYLLMFVAAVRLRKNDPDHPRGYRAPMLVGLCGVGFAASLAALLVGFVPPSQFGGGNPLRLRPDRRRRRPRARPARAVPLLQAPQAVVEAARGSGGDPVMTNYEGESQRHNRFIYWVAWGLLAVFIVIGLVTFDYARDTRQASEKADEFIAALDDAGLTAPSKDQITRILGDDGGALCDDPGDALRQATVNMQLANGAAGPGHAADPGRHQAPAAGPADRDPGVLPRRARGLPGVRRRPQVRERHGELTTWTSRTGSPT